MPLIYCTYLTLYRGNKLPPFYIGSSSIKRVKNGYHGSVQSRKYNNIWKAELKNNPNLFETVIISTHFTREDALNKEYKLQKQLNVVSSPLYINLSIAGINGFFGMSMLGKDSPSFGKKRSTEVKIKMGNINRNKIRITNNVITKYVKQEDVEYHLKNGFHKGICSNTQDKISRNIKGKLKGIPKTEEFKRKIRGIPKTEEHKMKLSNASKKYCWVNNGKENKHVLKTNIDNMLSNGYNRGRIVPWLNK